MSSHAGREWNSVVAAPRLVSKPPPTSQRPSLQLPPRQAPASAPAVPCRYTKAEMLAMYSPTDRPPTDYQFSMPVVSSECQAPVNSEPPSVSERDILESGTWYMPSARPNPASVSLKPGRNSSGRPPRTSSFSRSRPAPADDTTSSTSDYRPTRFNWRHDSHNAPGTNNDTDAQEHRRGSFAEKSSRASIGRSDAALSWRRGEDEEQTNTERIENDAAPPVEAPAWRSPTVLSRRQSVPEQSRRFPLPESDQQDADEGLVQPMSHLELVSKDSWWYQDPSGTIRGPFSSEEMRDWYQQSYFQLTLPVRCHPDQPFTPLGALFLQGDPAFLDHVPMVMAAPIESHRAPPPAPQPYIPVHPMQQRVMPMFQPQPPTYYPHSYVTPSQQQSMFRSTIPFPSTPLVPPVMDQPVEAWISRQAPNPDVIRQATPWMPFATATPASSQLNVVGDHRVESKAPEPIASVPEPLSSASTLHAEISQPIPVQDPSCYAATGVVSSVDQEQVGEPEVAVSQTKPEMEVVEEPSCSDLVDVYLDSTPSDNTASVVPESSSQSASDSSQPATSPVPHNGWVNSPVTNAAVKSLLEIQREEEELHKAQQTMKKAVQHEAQIEADSQSPSEPVSNPTSPWGAATSKSAARSLLEIQKQEEIMQLTKVSQRPVVSGWAAKVAPLASSWGAALKPAALSMLQIQEEEQRVLCQQKETAPHQTSSGWSTAVAGSAWARPAPDINQAAVRPAPAASSVTAAVKLQQQQSNSDSDDEPFWGDAKSKKSSKSDSSARNDFGGPVMSAEFREWCQVQLAAISSDCDVSLAEFLLTLESSEAIREYIYQYLGRSSKVEAFATGFLQHKDFDDSKHVVQSSRAHTSEKVVNNSSEDMSKKKKNRRRRKQKSEYP